MTALSASDRVAIDPDRFSVVFETTEDGRAVIVYYWAAEFGSNPSDSRRMFWIGARS